MSTITITQQISVDGRAYARTRAFDTVHHISEKLTVKAGSFAEINLGHSFEPEQVDFLLVSSNARVRVRANNFTEDVWSIKPFMFFKEHGSVAPFKQQLSKITIKNEGVQPADVSVLIASKKPSLPITEFSDDQEETQ